MDKKHRKRSSTSLAIREMHIKTTRHSSHPLGWLELKRQILTSIDKDVEKSEPSYTADALENSLAIPSDVKCRVSLTASNYTPRYTTKRNENMMLALNLYINLHSSIICITQNNTNVHQLTHKQ